ncbi:DMT family transporter [Sulfuritalea sp.]|uniref:DMT family transporter n=1 Tax=Sulfuritalea sp. TaxID=2480090 RepID=UPI0025E52803|nr:DMT family transporter [Sulfuritalea sp.]
MSSSPVLRFAPLLFVILWSTGFIGAKYGLPHAEPLSFLLVRYLLVVSLMTVIALAMRAPWPKDGRQWFHIGVSGLLVHAIYLGGVFVSISKGLPAGVASLVVGIQPLLTAVGAGWLLNEAVLARQWLGLVLGFVGVAMVVSGKIGSGFGLDALWPALAALAGITAGTLYQKRFCPSFDWRTGAIAQFLPTAVATGIVVGLSDNFRVEWAPDFIFALAWLVLVLSLGAISLLNMLIRKGTAVNLASLFYLVPPCTALIAWFLFDERLAGMALAGMALAVWGVYLARK